MGRVNKIAFNFIILFSFFCLNAGCNGGGGGGSKPINNIPVADAGADQNVDTGSSILLDGSGSSDPDGDEIAYSWFFVSVPAGSSAILANFTTVTPSFTADVDGVYEISLVVNDGVLDSETDTINVTASTPPTYTVSGNISVSANTAADSDVNDLSSPYQSNDSFETAQIISNPVTLGGYVNTAGTGASGRSYSIGDESDFFKAFLLVNQTITLYIADLDAADLDLYVYYNDEILFDSSVGTNVSESLTVLAEGDYYIEVYSYSGASNYTLIIGHSVSYSTAGKLRLNSEFVAGEVIARFKNDFFPAGTGNSKAAQALSAGMKYKAGALNREMLLTFKDDVQKAKVFQTLMIQQKKLGIHTLKLKNSFVQHKLDTLQVIKALRGRGDVIYAEPNYIRKHCATPDDAFYSFQWHYPLINLPHAWDISTGSSDVIVAVIDTGVLMSHPDLAGKLTTDGYDFIRNPERAADGDGIDDNPDDPGDEDQGRSSFHGTHVAGTIAAATNNNAGVAGIAWPTKVMPLRALGINGGTSYDINQAIRYAAGLSNDSGTLPINKADIINMSLGGSSFSQADQDVCTAARNAGVIIIAAAGNESTGQWSYPASYDGVISVSAVDINAEQAHYSNYGTKIDVAAPGGDTSQDYNGDGQPDGILSTCGDDSSGTIQYEYSFMAGTSMAAPHVAGVAALMKAVFPELTPETLDSLLLSGGITTDLGDVGRDDLYGVGLINAYKAVVAAQGLANGEPLPTTLVVTPASLNFGSMQTNTTLTARKQGDGSLTGIVVSDNAAWLTVLPETVDSDGLGTYIVHVDRTGLEDGSYSAILTFTVTSENSINIPVSIKVESAEITGDAGYHYVMLLDSDTLENKSQVELEAVNGVYPFSITEVTKGSYYLYAGTDFDNDYICGDAGEALGAYFTLDQRSIVRVDNNLSGLDFSTSFNINLPNASSASSQDIKKKKSNRSAFYRK